jgi:hypothetical protein
LGALTKVDFGGQEADEVAFAFLHFGLQTVGRTLPINPASGQRRRDSPPLLVEYAFAKGTGWTSADRRATTSIGPLFVLASRSNDSGTELEESGARPA